MAVLSGVQVLELVAAVLLGYWMSRMLGILSERQGVAEVDWTLDPTGRPV